MRKKKPRVRCDEVPIFCGLVATKGFDPDAVGPEAIGRFVGLGLDYRQYEFDWDSADHYRTPSMREIQAAIPTGAWPTIGEETHGTSGKLELASTESGPPL